MTIGTTYLGMTALETIALSSPQTLKILTMYKKNTNALGRLAPTREFFFHLIK